VRAIAEPSHTAAEPRGPRPSRLVAALRGFEPRTAISAVVRGYSEHDLLTYASAISFQVFFALIPLALFSLGALGFLHLDDVWQRDLADQIRPNVSRAAFTVIDDTVESVLHRRQIFWVTLGAAITVWEISGAMRAVMGVFDDIYAVEDRRSFWPRLVVSLVLAAVAGVLLIAAAVIARFGAAAVRAALGTGPVVHIAGVAARWGLAIALLLLVVGILSRFAPSQRRPVRWAGFGALLVVAGWLGMSLVFGWYVTSVADYSIFGSLATIIVTLEYLYLSSIVFLTGIELDALTRRQLEPEGATR
jgi:membrane protein